MINFDTPEPPRGRELFPLIAALADMDRSLAPMLIAMPGLPADVALRILDVDRLKLIGKIAAGALESNIDAISPDERCVLIMSSVVGMIRDGASPGEVRRVLTEVLSTRVAQDAMARAAEGAKA
jgi:hypothetical protein